MFSRSPYHSYYPSYDDYYGYQNPYQNPYARAQAQAQAEQQRRAQLLVLERQREAERRRLAELEAAQRQQRAGQYLPEASMMYPGGNRFYVPERASRYLPEEFDGYGSVVDDDNDRDAYDYGFGRAGSYWNGWPSVPMSREGEGRSSKSTSQPQMQTRKAEQPRRQSRSRSRAGPTGTQSHPLRSPSRPREQSRTPVPEPHPPKSSPQSSPAAVDTPISSPSPPQETMEEAATKIQTTYRIHRALRTIEQLSKRFEAFKSSFALPTAIDFQLLTPEHHISMPLHDITPSKALDALNAAGTDVDTVEHISRPKLAYTHANAPLHGYVESLSRLLTSLDGVESYGEKRVREKRKEVVRAVEAEAGRIEDTWKQAWDEWISALQLASDDTHEQEEVKSIAILDPSSTLPSRDEDDEVQVDEGFASAPEDVPERSEGKIVPDMSIVEEVSGKPSDREGEISSDYVML